MPVVDGIKAVLEAVWSSKQTLLPVLTAIDLCDLEAGIILLLFHPSFALTLQSGDNHSRHICEMPNGFLISIYNGKR